MSLLKIATSGRFWLCYFGPKGVKPEWEVVLRNGPTIEGVNYVLNAGYRGATASSSWYVGLIDNTGYSAPTEDDTHAAHPWSEFTSIFLSQRAAWSPAAAAGGQLNYSAVASISITGDGSLRGAFLANRQATGLAAGSILYSTAPADSGLSVSAGGTVLAGYKLRLRAA